MYRAFKLKAPSVAYKACMYASTTIYTPHVHENSGGRAYANLDVRDQRTYITRCAYLDVHDVHT